MKITKLLRMPLAEIVGRGRQQAAHWRDRAHRPRSRRWAPATLSAKLAGAFAATRDSQGVARMLLEEFRESVPMRFFLGATSAAVADLVDRRMPDVRERLLAEAHGASRGRFDLLGYRDLDFGDPVDWHLEPVANRRAPLVHGSRVDFLDPGLVGDSKVVWELNRHQWLVRLGQAWQLTGDGRHAKAFALHVRSWLGANPRGLGINWASSLEVALRLMAWAWALVLFRRSDELSPELFGTMLDAVADHATHIERHLSHYFAPNTHLTGEALGLVYAGTIFPALAGAERWRRVGSEILLTQSERQQLPDGVYFEQSTWYQRYTIEIYLHYMILARRNGLEVPASLAERVQRMLDFLLTIRRPDGALPQIGDSDGGWLLPLTRREPADCRDVFSTAAVVFGRADYAWAAGGLAPETLWLLGREALESLARLQPRPPAGSVSRVFPHGGWVVLRDSWEPQAHQLVLDAGPLGCPVSGGHGHADLLSLQCSAFGEPYLVDAGTYCYTADAAWRDFFRGTAAHSTVVVDGLDQATPTGPFAWRTRPGARLRHWHSCERYDLADAEHDAYGRLPDPVRHRRRVLFVKPRYWIVVDDLEGLREHRVELGFTFAPVELVVARGLAARARGRDGRGLWLEPFAAVPLSVEIQTGHADPFRGWVSPVYGQRVAAPRVVYTATTRLPLRVVTLLWPLASADDAGPEAVPLGGADGRLAGLVIGGERMIFRDDGIELLTGWSRSGDAS